MAARFHEWSDYGLRRPMDGYLQGRRTAASVGRARWWSAAVHLRLKITALIDRIKPHSAQLTPELIASLLGSTSISWGGRSAPSGIAEASVTYSRIWGKHALLLFVPSSPSLMTPAAGYCFVWQIVPNALQYIKSMRNEEREIDIIEANSYFAQKRTAAKAGAFLEDAVA
jgi:hypothetical protein